MCIRDSDNEDEEGQFDWVRITSDLNQACEEVHPKKAGPEPVSYTHLTLPTSDLV